MPVVERLPITGDATEYVVTLDDGQRQRVIDLVGNATVGAIIAKAIEEQAKKRRLAHLAAH